MLFYLILAWKYTFSRDKAVAVYALLSTLWVKFSSKAANAKQLPDRWGCGIHSGVNSNFGSN